MLQEKLKELYGLQAELEQLVGEWDLNFKATASNGKEYIVKVMRKGCEEGLIALQCATLFHLENTTKEILLPNVVLTKNQQPYAKLIVDGAERLLWVLTYCSGTLLAKYSPHSSKLMYSFGTSIAHLTNGLEGFNHPAMKRNHYWELTKSKEVQPLTVHIQGAAKEQAKTVFKQFEEVVYAKLIELPHSVIHNDANDYNVLVNETVMGEARVNAIFDFGDMSYQPTICELAVALAYAVLDKERPLQVCGEFLKGYTAIRSLLEAEIEILLDLIKTRLAVSIATSSYRQIKDPDDPYITLSQAPAKKALDRLSQVNSNFALALFRQAAGYPVTKHAPAVLHYLINLPTRPFPVMEVDSFKCILDLSVGSLMLGADPTAVTLNPLTKSIWKKMEQANVAFSIGRYAENRHLYAASGFGDGQYPTQEKRTNHIGLDLFCEAGLPVFAPFDAIVEYVNIIDLPLDYGGMLVLKHQTPKGHPFYTLYGHLSHDTLKYIAVGQQIKAGEKIATIGADHENGGWPPHLHLQIIIDFLDKGIHFPGVALESEAAVYKALCPNPALLLNVSNIAKFDATPNLESILARRKLRVGYNLSISYAKPLHIVKGYKQFLYDSQAQAYLDVYNNVPHVGHSHPHVVNAIQKEVGLLNTNTRYLHDRILEYAERLTAKMPEGLDVCYFVNSASEANELSLRLARNYTKRQDMMVVASAYHGHTSTLIDLSPYKHNGPGGQGAPNWVHEVPIADDYRGAFKSANPNVGELYAQQVYQTLQELSSKGRQIAAFIAETYPSVGGQIIPPSGYLKKVYEYMRAHGALCIADEVQTGFGRLGDSFWAFETQQVIPDIVVLGKPIANGFPMGAVVTTKAIAAAFDNGMEFFSTFGGNPVACAAALAVLDVLETENLQANAKKLGAHFLKSVKELQVKQELIGDVRGEGFFLGVELVKDRTTLSPAAQEASYIVNRLREQHILAGTDGPLHNVLKFRPSMVLEQRDMDYLLSTLERIFEETTLGLIKK